jgi:phage shock protein A
VNVQPPQAESFLDRVIRIIRQKLVARANRLDDPSEAIDVVMAQQLDAINRTRGDLAAVVVGEKRLGMLLDELEQRAHTHLAAAQGARRAGDERAAHTAMRRAIGAERLQTEARAHLADVGAQRRTVETLLEEMRAQYDRLRLRRESVRAMASAARAVAASHESMTPLGPNGADREQLLQRARETLADLRARAEALAELRATGALAAVGASEFDDQPQIADDEVQCRLNELPDAR